jgi:ABC-type phosphate transport system ATPase subunit
VIETSEPATTSTSDKIVAKDVDIYYGSFQAIKHASLSMKAQQVTALIGPSGCGKSTFLRALNRMHDLTPGARVEGSILLDGEDIYGAAADPVVIRHRIGMVFQRPNPFPRPSTRTSSTVRASTARRTRENSTRSSSTRCAAPPCGMRSKTACTVRLSISRAASSSACASRARSRSIPK